VADDEAKEVVLYPVSESIEAFRVFSLTGKELKKVRLEKRHHGVSLSLGIEKSPEKQSVAIIYGTNSKDGALAIYKDFSVARKATLDFMRSLGALASGDMDGDGKTDYAVAAGSGDAPILAYFNSNGEETRRFNAFSGSNKAGISLVMADINGDGKDEAVVALLGVKEPVRAWSNKSKNIQEWWPFGEGQGVVRNLFVWYSRI
jgi:hypothetical protein